MNFSEVINKPEISDDIAKGTEEVAASLLPHKSKERYEKEYEHFCKWRFNKNIKHVSDDVLHVYLCELSKHMKPTSLWSKFSMIKNCLLKKEDVNSDFAKTVAFLKHQSTGYKSKKSKTLTSDQVTQFMNEAPDEEWLLCKVILILGIFGACRRDDLLHLSLKDIEDNGRYLIVFLRDWKSHTQRSFIITNEGCNFKPCDLYRKYISLRPIRAENNRLLICYRNGKCIAQNVGTHSISAIPCKIAKYLNLKNPEEYTGHCFRRTSASILAEGRGHLLALRMPGGGCSSSTTEGYFDSSGYQKIEVSEKQSKSETVTTEILKEEEDHESDIDPMDSMPSPDPSHSESVETMSGSEIIKQEEDHESVIDPMDSMPSPDPSHSESVENMSGSARNLFFNKRSLLTNGFNIQNNINCTFSINFN